MIKPLSVQSLANDRMVKLIILAAGAGTRLRPHTNTVPKCMVPVCGRPLIHRLVCAASIAGITEIVIVKGYRASKLELPFEASTPKVEFVTNHDFATTNMVYSLWKARHEITDPVVISYSDILYQPDVLSSLIESNDEISVVVDRNWRQYWEERFEDPLSDAESLVLDLEGGIKDIGQKVDLIDDIEGQYIGLMKFSGKGVASLLEKINAAESGLLPCLSPFRKLSMTELLQDMIRTGSNLRPFWIEGKWVEIDTARDLKIAEQFLCLSEESSASGFEIHRPVITGGNT